MRLKGYRTVKGNEKEIINHLIKHNYYNYWDVEKDDKIILFNIDYKIFFTNEDASFFKYESDGRINVVFDRYDCVDYIAVPFSIASQDMIKILQAQNFCKFGYGKRWDNRHIIEKLEVKNYN